MNQKKNLQLPLIKKILDQSKNEIKSDKKLKVNENVKVSAIYFLIFIYSLLYNNIG